MTLEEANKIFEHWKGYSEIADKMHKIFLVVPESFLPYPIDILEEALNIVAKHYFDSGDKRTANIIQETMMLQLGGYCLGTDSEGKTKVVDKITDEEVLQKMKKDLDFMLDNPELLKVKLDNLKKSAESWAALRESENKE